MSGRVLFPPFRALRRLLSNLLAVPSQAILHSNAVRLFFDGGLGSFPSACHSIFGGRLNDGGLEPITVLDRSDSREMNSADYCFT
jgi:hypothetical protein